MIMSIDHYFSPTPSVVLNPAVIFALSSRQKRAVCSHEISKKGILNLTHVKYYYEYSEGICSHGLYGYLHYKDPSPTTSMCLVCALSV